jgi:hypothetical protein
MRIGIGLLLGLGDPPGPTPAAVIADMVNPYTIGYPVGFTPDQLRANVAEQVRLTCITWPDQCPGGPSAASSLIDAAVQSQIAAGKFGPVQASGTMGADTGIVPAAATLPVVPQITPAQLPPTMPNIAVLSPAPSSAQPAVATSTSAMDWLKGSMIAGVPNWALVAIALGGAYYFFGRTKR